jgi:hypothetical protein
MGSAELGRHVEKVVGRRCRFSCRRRLELAAGAPRGKGQPGIWAAGKALRQAELELALQAEIAHRRHVSDWQPHKGAGATPGRASQGRQSGKQRGKASVPDPAL